MDDVDSHRVRISGNDSPFDLHQSSCSTERGHTGASLPQCPSGLECKTAQKNAFDVKAAMEEASQRPDAHRLAVLPSRANSSVAVIEAKTLTTSDQQLVLSRATETKGQDNDRLLTKIRERQDRYRHHVVHLCMPFKFDTALVNTRHASTHQLDTSAALLRLIESGHMPHSIVSEGLQRLRQVSARHSNVI